MYALCRRIHSSFFFLKSLSYTTLPRFEAPLNRKKMTTSRPFTPARDFSFSELYDYSVSSLDDLVSGPSTPFEGSLLSPATISYPTNNHTGAYTAKRSQENDAYIQLMHRCRRLEEELTRERQAHNSLKYVHLSLALYNVLTHWIQDGARKTGRDAKYPYGHVRWRSQTASHRRYGARTEHSPAASQRFPRVLTRGLPPNQVLDRARVEGGQTQHEGLVRSWPSRGGGEEQPWTRTS